MKKDFPLMDPSSETDNKLRWHATFGGVTFQLYIPKKRVPRPWPSRIVVAISDQILTDKTAPWDPVSSSNSNDIDLELPIIAVVERFSEHTKTVRFRPSGTATSWELGEPYIPYSLLPRPDIQRLQVEVRWDRSAGTWSD